MPKHPIKFQLAVILTSLNTLFLSQRKNWYFYNIIHCPVLYILDRRKYLFDWWLMKKKSSAYRAKHLTTATFSSKQVSFSLNFRPYFSITTPYFQGWSSCSTSFGRSLIHGALWSPQWGPGAHSEAVHSLRELVIKAESDSKLQSLSSTKPKLKVRDSVGFPQGWSTKFWWLTAMLPGKGNNERVERDTQS